MRKGATRFGAVLVATTVGCGCALGAPPASARWIQITHAHSGSRSNLGLARDAGGTLHVIWAGPNRGPFHSILDTPVSPAGRVGAPAAIVSGWSGVNAPAAVASPAGVINAVISGQMTGLPTDPHDGLTVATGPRPWTLAPQAFGNSSITEASNAVLATALLRTGQLITVWRSAATFLYEIGVSSSTPPVDITPPDLADDPVIAVDGRTGAAVVAYRGLKDGRNFFRQLFPSVGSPQALPPAKTDAPQIAARVGGGIYTAYTPDFAKVRLLRFGGRALGVPVPKGVEVLTAGVAAAPGGRLWVFYGNQQKTYVTRTNGAGTRFERVQTIPSPPQDVQYFRLEGEGSRGPLDLFADVTVDGAQRDGSYYTQVRPALSIAVGRGRHHRITVRVLDAGDAVAGARVSGIPGGARTTNARGSVTFTTRGTSVTLRATKAGYVAASASLSA